MSARAPKMRVGTVGAAISTTGDPHRVKMLFSAVDHWRRALPAGSPLFVTMDCDSETFTRVASDLLDWTPEVEVYQVGQPPGTLWSSAKRMGVAANKNTGIDLLMGREVNHLFLSDDDIWPLRPESLDLHCGIGRRGHSMVNWGQWYLRDRTWVRPRGSMLYVSSPVVMGVGGMVEAFGTGGHEHVEWSNRIHEARFSDVFYPAPREYLEANGMGAAAFWHAEDMPQPGEDLRLLRARRDKISSMKRVPGAEARSDQIMKELKGSTAFVPYAAAENGRASATLYHN